MLSSFDRRILLLSILLLLPIVGGLSTYVVLQVKSVSYLSPANYGYTEPSYVGDLVEDLQQALVTIDCKGVFGSGFSFDLDNADLDNGYKFLGRYLEGGKSRLITNAHVVKECLAEKKVNFFSSDGKSHQAQIEILDESNDLALLSSSIFIEGISGVYWKPRPGYWVMGMGSPHRVAGSVTFGNIINFDEKSIFHTASLSPGSSGGPLVDNEGFLYGVNTGSKPIGQNFNISISLNAFCDAIVKCPEGTYWED